MPVDNLRFPIGTKVMCMDQLNLRLEPKQGVIVGIDPCPPPKVKRKGPCYVIRFPKGHWEHREEDEVTVLPEEQANLDTVVIPLTEQDRDPRDGQRSYHNPTGD